MWNWNPNIGSMKIDFGIWYSEWLDLHMYMPVYCFALSASPSSFSFSLSLNVLSRCEIVVSLIKAIDLYNSNDYFLHTLGGIKSSKNTIMKWFYFNSSKWKLIAWLQRNTEHNVVKLYAFPIYSILPI